MGRGEREVEKEGLGPVAGSGVDPGDGFLGKAAEHLLVLERGSGGTGAPVYRKGLAFGAPGRKGFDAVVLQEGIGRHIERGGDAVEVIEAERGGTAAEGFSKVGVFEEVAYWLAVG